jgi:hypothetical protein
MKGSDVLYISSHVHTQLDQSDPLLVSIMVAVKVVLAGKPKEPVILKSGIYIYTDGAEKSREYAVNLAMTDVGYKFMNFLLKD